MVFEIGHYFGLLHTHSTFNGIEFANGSNCAVAGDLHCDTPADYNLSLGGLTSCTYTGQFVDLNGDPYNPNPSNVMSYAPPNCLRRLSDSQINLARFYGEEVIQELTEECPLYPDYAIRIDQDNLEIRSGETFPLEVFFESFDVTSEEEVDIYLYLSDDASVLGQIIYRGKILF